MIRYWEENVEAKIAIPFDIKEHDKELLDKIRAEIVALKSHHINDCYDDGFQGCKTNVLQILDKYRGESETYD